jgi:hypothetical protein
MNHLAIVKPGETPAIVTSGPGAIMPDFSELQLMVEAMAKSGFFKSAQDYNKALTVALIGREMGVAPATAISGIHVIEGKPSMGANLMAALIKRSGKYTYRVVTNTTSECQIEFFEKVDGKFMSIGTSEFTADDARSAGVLGKDNWKKYPKSMFFARALSIGARTHTPDVFGGHAVYHEGEIEATRFVEENGQTGVPATASIEVLGNEARRVRKDCWGFTPADSRQLGADAKAAGVSTEDTIRLTLKAEEIGIVTRAQYDEFAQMCNDKGYHWMPALASALHEGCADYESLTDYVFGLEAQVIE